jgi:hypothetical protein
MLRCAPFAILLVAPLVALAQDTPKPGTDPFTDFAQVEALYQARPEAKAERPAWRERTEGALRAYVAYWEEKIVDYPRGRVPMAKAHILLAQASEGDAAKMLEHAKRAELHVKAYRSGRDKDMTGRQMLVLAERTLRQAEERMAIAKKAEAARAVRERLIGRRAPNLGAEEAIGGGEVARLAGLRGKVVVIDFWATWRASSRSAVATLRTLAARDGVAVVGVTKLYGYGYVPGPGNTRGEIHRTLEPDAERKVVAECAKVLEIGYPVVLAPKAYAPYGVHSLPQRVVLDKLGKVRHIEVGKPTPELDAAVEACLKE